METLAHNTDLALHLTLGDSGLFALGRSNRNLVWWAPVTAIRLLVDILARRSASYLFGDALAWALLGWIPRLFHVPAFTMVCGLDITFSNRLYRALVHPRLRQAPRVLAISAATLGQAVEAGVQPDRASVITMGLVPPPVHEVAHDLARASVLADYSLPDDAIVLLTTGRLVRRKGVRWFTREVMPLLESRFHYLVVGTGADEDAIAADAVTTGISDRVHLLGYVADDVRQLVLDGSDFFVQPNIPVAGDMEGFGLVVVESAQSGLLTIAADLEGLKDAVRPGITGFRVASEDADAWAATLTDLAARPDRRAMADEFRAAALEIYSLNAMGTELSAYAAEAIGDA
jgi:phosphatidylinositol alpha-1,6-mannosyltransferase